MRARFTLPVLAIGAGLFGCDGGSTAPRHASSAPPSFITHGTVDRNAHPAVVLLVMDVAKQPTYVCSGTLIAPTVVLTAGHCTGEPGEFSGVRIFTESDVGNGTNNFPFAGPNTVEASVWHSHPLYTNAAFFLHDVGVVLLSKAVKLSSGDYGKLPSQDQLDALQPGSSTVFTAVGYGIQRINPVKLEWELTRMFARPHLIQINTGFTGDFSLMLSNNAATGGTCFGDSGGPNYLGTSNVIAGVTSFGLNGSCGGTGGVFRLDRRNVLDFVTQYLK